jgi:hypothetical protein
MDAAHGNRLSRRFNTRVRALQGTGEDVSYGDQVFLGENVSQLVTAVRERRPVGAQSLLVQVSVLVGDERPMMTIVCGQQRAERVRVAGVEGGEIGLRDGLRLLCGGGRAGSAILRQRAGDWHTRRQDGNQASSRLCETAPCSPVIRQSRQLLESLLA